MKRSTKTKIEKKMKIWKWIIYTKVFRNYLENSEFNLDEICKNIEECSSLIRLYLKYYPKVYDYLHVKGYSIPNPYADNSLYKYESIENIKLDLKYMSDRFADPKKVAWLMNVPMEVSKLKSKGV